MFPIINGEQTETTKHNKARQGEKKKRKERMPRTLFFVTGNANKLAEVSAILATSGISIQSKALDLPELQGTIEDVSKDKAKRAVEVVCLDSRILSPSSSSSPHHIHGGKFRWW